MSMLEGLLELLPSFAQSVPGTQIWAFVSAIGSELDRLATYARYGYNNWFVASCAEDALALHGAARKIPKFPVESFNQYRARLLTAHEWYTGLGTENAIISGFKALGYEAEVVYARDMEDIDGIPWNTIWVRVNIDVPVWNQPEEVWNQPEEVWSQGLDSELLALFTDLVLRARPCYCYFYAFLFNGIEYRVRRE